MEDATTGAFRFVVVAGATARERFFTPEALATLAAAGAITHLDLSLAADEVERASIFDAAVAAADAVVVAPWGRQGIPPFTPERWERAPLLKAMAGTFDHRFDGWLDVAEAQRRGVAVIDTSRSMTPTVAEFALAMMLNLLRDIPDEVARVRQGGWKDGWADTRGFVAGDLTGRRVGLAGFGVICRRLAELLAPFCCDVATYDPFVPDEELAQRRVRRAGSLLELAAGSELFVVGIPPTPATQQIISRAVIDALPRGALFVLVTRMAVVEQDALWRRTRAGEIRAAVDVFSPEPPPVDSPIRTDPNVLPTPHRAGDTAQAHRRCFTLACAEAVAAVQGRALTYAITVRDAAIYAGKLPGP
jgi:phosphoglycerate dehydrogenase-like enzyme